VTTAPPAPEPVLSKSFEEMPEQEPASTGIPSFLSGIGNDEVAEHYTPSTEANQPPTLNDAIEKKRIADLRKAFSLNDRFRYRKELFGGSEESMNNVINILNDKPTLNESVLFLEQKLHWNFNDPSVKDFIKILELRYL